MSSLKNMGDNELVRAYLGGRTGAFSVIAERYRPKLVNFIYRTTGDRERAEDLVQETFIRVFRHIHRFDQAKKFSTWIYTIASNLAKNELRNRKRNPLVLMQQIERNQSTEMAHRPIEWEDFRYKPEDLFHKRHLKRLVEDTVNVLPQIHQDVFRLRELEGRSYEEIGEITGITLGTVKSRLNRARNNFKAIIAPQLV